MNSQEKKRLLIGNGLLWAAAVGTPVLVQVLLDAANQQTPGRVAIISVLALFLISAVSTVRLSTALRSVGE